MQNKSQISFEFIMIFSLVFFALSGFIYVINDRMNEISVKQEELIMKSLADSIINEIVLASSFNNNYMRRFDVPVKLFGQDYNMSIEDNFIHIEVIENGNVRIEHFAAFPIHVKGSFIDEINLTNTEHCVTKNDFDGVRISKNQASLDVLSSSVRVGEEFELYVSLHCIEDAKSFTVTVEYDPDMVEFVEARPVIRSIEFKDKNPLFEDYKLIFNFENSPEHIDDSIGRYSYGYLGSNCVTGSGNVAVLVFEAKQSGDSKIKFDDRINENLKILDCNTNKFTKEGLPETRSDALFSIMLEGCGDGILDFGEECDDGNWDNTDSCLNTCQDAICGDGYLWDGEEICDDGNDNDNDACRNDCTIANCGDGVLDFGEECDDGNLVNTDACLDNCQDADCTDGYVWQGIETCDDGNTDQTDLCNNICELTYCGDTITQNPNGLGTNGATGIGDEICDSEVGAACTTVDGYVGNNDCLADCSTYTTCVTTEYCGDGIINGNEDCDDGNNLNGDGCSATCENLCINQNRQMIFYAPFDDDPHDHSSLNNGGNAVGVDPTNNAKIGQAVLFDDILDAIVWPDLLEYDLKNCFSVETWIYFEDLENAKTIFCQRFGPQDHQSFCLRKHTNDLTSNNNTIIIEICDDETCSNRKQSKSVTMIEEDTWYYLTITYNGHRLKVFINGIQEGNSLSSFELFDSDAALFVGDTKDMVIDELKIYNYPLYDAEILSNFNLP
ncbi:DUF4215 domain-containing protein [archaeon]|jgi:cysteine-rich repeat protein|nr:DUF4215 domain-containing protein [archaeon]MBT4022736.1 DUF4215 domain-containing protein [archaeon]MBT4273070.1 DUF4215 domain-containing protein [archaeon]MBT4461051.1 DUF4215 domain-containing protein [archaeon]MBT4858055.1 DUF4215 domain-containing protein [archaeon]